MDKLITCSREVSRRLINASLFVSILLVLLISYHALTESGNSGKLCHMLSVTPTTIYGHSGKPRRKLSVTLTIQRPYMAIQENLIATFRDTDDPTTIYAHSGKCRCMLTVTLTIQRPYMADLGYYRKLSCHTRTCKESCCFLSFILVK